jgi:hypothetical protein
MSIEPLAAGPAGSGSEVPGYELRVSSLENPHIMKGKPMAALGARRSVEELAQILYEASDPSGIPWVKRGLAVRDPWLQVARKQIAQSENVSESNRRIRT